MNNDSECRCRVLHPPAALLVSLCLACAAPLAGASEWAQCGGALVLPPVPSQDAQSEEPDAIHVEADDADLSQENTSTLLGNVHLRRGSRYLRAESVVYKHESEEADAEGDVKLWDEGLFVSAERAHVGLAEDSALAERARFMLQKAHARGGAKRIEVQKGELLLAEDAHYTTCNPDDAAWVLEAGHIELDREKEIGIARNVRIRLHRVPVFYAPFLTFPLNDERKSGFLPPNAGITDTSGLELTASYYFNLAPNRDATLAARWLGERGTQAIGEYRYLMPWGAGSLTGEYITDDRKFGGERGALGLRHLGTFAPRWSADVDYRWVSDDRYIDDFELNPDRAALSHLPQRADLAWSGPWFSVRGRVQDYQTLDDGIAAEDLPYARLPQVLATTRLPERNRRLNFAGAAELVHFERDTGVTGARFDLRSSLRFPVRSPSGFLIPQVGLRLTRYDLSGLPPDGDDSPSRLLPTFSVDGGLVYERDLAFGDGGLVQTLEPRAYYLLVPSRNQDDQPLFDTGYASFDFAQLFRENRFNGADRIGDANQLTLAVTSRLLAPESATELARLSVGQIYHFRDREITLTGAAPEDDAVSDIVAEGTLNVRHPWRLRGALHWDPDGGRTSKASAALRYQPESGRLVNAAYRFLRADPLREHDELEQVDLSLAWPLRGSWRAIGHWRHALNRNRGIESFAGLEYNGCCFAMRTVLRRHLASATDEYTNALYLHFELKGLGGAGSGRADFVARGIPGYESPF